MMQLDPEIIKFLQHFTMSKLFFSVKCPWSPFPVLFQEPAKKPLGLKHGAQTFSTYNALLNPRLAC